MCHLYESFAIANRLVAMETKSVEPLHVCSNPDSAIYQPCALNKVTKPVCLGLCEMGITIVPIS